MALSVKRVDDANIELKGEISKRELDEKLNKLAKSMVKEIHIDGFRKGKVPVSIIKKVYNEELTKDSESQLINDIIDNFKREESIENDSIIGSPVFREYIRRDDGGVNFEILIFLYPKVEVDGYRELLPKYDIPEISEEEVERELKDYIKDNPFTEEIKEERELKIGDFAVIDFKGFLNGKPFKGGEGKNHKLNIGAGKFLEDLENGLVGMKKGETKEIEAKFPEDYHSDDLRGKSVKFVVTLKEIHKEINPKDEVDELKSIIREELLKEKLGDLYREELKPHFLNALVDKFEFALPQNVLEQEIDNFVNRKIKSMSKEEIEKIDTENRIADLRESVKEDAIASVKAAFIVDAIAKMEGISVSNDELYQMVYYQALINGEEPSNLISYYEKNNIMPALKMGLLEDKLFMKLLKLDHIESSDASNIQIESTSL